MFLRQFQYGKCRRQRSVSFLLRKRKVHLKSRQKTIKMRKIIDSWVSSLAQRAKKNGGSEMISDLESLEKKGKVENTFVFDITLIRNWTVESVVLTGRDILPQLTEFSVYDSETEERLTIVTTDKARIIPGFTLRPLIIPREPGDATNRWVEWTMTRKKLRIEIVMPSGWSGDVRLLVTIVQTIEVPSDYLS